MTQAPNAGHVRVFREDDPFIPLGGAAVTIGRFDGVHRGHQALLRATCRAAAAQDGGRAIAVTLWPPPEWVLRPSEPRQLLTTLDDRIDLLATSGVDDVIVLRFDRQFSRRSANEFLRDLIERLAMRTLVTGPNAAIGRDREGTPDVIASLAPRLGFTHVAVRYEGEPGAISSSRARETLAAGEVDRLHAILDRAHSLFGTVARGDGRGRDLGFPTANVQTPPWLVLPADGVYAGTALVDADPTLYPALISVGTRPTFGLSHRLFEVHLLGFDREIYGCGLRTFIRAWLRGQQAFHSVEELVAAMHRDREAAERIDLGGSEQAMPFLRAPG
ncbi:MAG: bifunctional riboflavin kinase/FMN adenylyltransferase [Chloroflexota bacterium]|nr:bifunctional riboflavin kinase/FMN adenylyltransferase [Chloroflexota bacterium]MDE2921173.1 bifunctional riboflavin kinase/FMN adenylyltransferase [Chloroflexota bacterium]